MFMLCLTISTIITVLSLIILDFFFKKNHKIILLDFYLAIMILYAIFNSIVLLITHI